MFIQMQPRASLPVRLGLIIAGAITGLFSLFLSFAVAIAEGTGPYFTGHKHFVYLICREIEWLLTCAVLLPITFVFPNRHMTLSIGIGLIAIGLGVGLYLSWNLAEPNLNAPDGYEGNWLGPGEMMSVCLIIAGIFRLYLAQRLHGKTGSREV